MSDKFQNKYRIPSARLQNWDYGSNAMYFVTICTAHRECYFGDIINGVMVFTEIGKIVETEWLKTFELRQDMNLQIDDFVVMPNHFHAIVIIGENEYNKRGEQRGDKRTDKRTEQRGEQRRDAMHGVSTDHPDHPDDNKNKFGPQSKNLASIIRGFKSAVTINARNIHADFAWQPRYHDHIIRNDESFQRISNYIATNPLKWTDDKFFR